MTVSVERFWMGGAVVLLGAVFCAKAIEVEATTARTKQENERVRKRSIQAVNEGNTQKKLRR